MKYSILEKALFGAIVVSIIVSIAVVFIPNMLLYVG